MAPVSWQAELIERYSQNRESTLKVARQHDWPLRKNYSSQRVLQLQEIDDLGHPVYYTLHNAEAARGTRTQALYGMGTLPIALSGNSAIMSGRLGLWDGGQVRVSHQEFRDGSAARIVQKDNSATLNDHTTHLAGTLIAQGINAQAKGMAYGAQLSVWDYTDDIAELTTAAPNLLLSNHAYGPVVGWVYNASRPGTNPNLKWEWWGNTAISETEDYLFGFYTTKARDIDRIAYNNPFFLMVRSADNKRSETGPPANTPYFIKNTATQSTLLRSRNDAYDVIPAEATAKNVLTIGAADVSFTNQNSLVFQGSTTYSGWGPTDDGRIKPDLLGIGSGILSSLSTSDTAYDLYTGTSMASANVTGSLFLLQELYAHQHSSGLPGGQFMRAATLKALAIHTASRATPAAGPDYRQGWGLLNAEAAARVLLNENLAYLVLEKSLTPNGAFTQSVMAQGNEPLVVTLSWTDPEGTATNVTAGSINNRTPRLVNDLDLRLINGQQVDLPFVLDPNQPGQAATRGDNIRDNVEQIYIANPTPGQTYALTVSYKGKMTYSSQPFSVIVSGLHRANCQLTAAIQSVPDTTICAGTILTLRPTIVSADLQYQWFRNGVAMPNNSSGPIYQATQPGSYLVRITNGSGCSATSQPVQIQVRTAMVNATPNGNQWLCSTKDAIQLHTTVPTTGSTDTVIDWLQDGVVIVDAHTATLTVTQPGRYQVRTTQAGCQALSAETKVSLTSVNKLDLLPVETELTLPQGATVTLKAPVDTSYQYQWYHNDQALVNAHEYSLSVSQAGVYKVQVTQQNCVGWSASKLVQTSVLTALTPDPAAQFTLYPNPADQTLSIRYATALTNQVQISVFDLRGVLQTLPITLKSQNGRVEGNLPVQELPAGQYILCLTDGILTQTGRFMKK